MSRLMAAKAEAWELLLCFVEFMGMFFVMASFVLLAVGLAPVVGLN